jgi:sugar-specific transcriptional regulator TrmB
MTNNKIQTLLEELGLTKGEIKVYLSLLEIGETTTGKIIDKAQISAGKVYQILEKLIQKGLVGYIVKKKTKYFNAQSPKRILDIIHEKEKALKTKEKEINKLLPTLIAMQNNTKTTNESKFFSDYKGINTTIFEFLDSLKEGDEINAMGIQTKRNKKYNLMWLKWHKERIKRKIKCKLLFSNNNEYLKELKKMKYTKVKVLKGITPATINVCKDKTLIFTFQEEPGCLSIRNKDIATSFESFFENLWKLGK